MKALLFKGLLLFSLLIGFATLVTLLIDVASDGLGKLSWDFLTSFPSSFPSRAGIESPIVGTILLMLLTALFAIPIGVGAAIYLEEYADKERWYNRMIEVNIQNLAAVPSIVYGILGLAFLVRGLGLGRVLLAGALTLTLLVLPIVIIASREAIRAVPTSIREAALALGATPLADDPPAAAAGRPAGHRDGLDPGALAGDRRDRTADPDRRDRVRAVQPHRSRQRFHCPADTDLQLDHPATAGVQAAGGRSDPGAAGAAPDDECFCNLAQKPLSEEMVNTSTRQMPEGTRRT